MTGALPNMPEQFETVAELRQLYRAAEARAARLRLLARNGRDLAEARPATVDAVLAQVATRLAHFLGRASAQVVNGPEPAPGLPLPSPGDRSVKLGHVVIDGLVSVEDIADAEDREVVALQLEQMALAIDRIEREQRLEFVIGRLFNAQEEERRRVSHELHDGVAQTATALVRMLDGSGRGSERLAEIGRGLVRELRSVIGGLRPPQLDDLGLEAALRTLADELRSDGYEVDVRIGPGPMRWPPHGETAMYRVGQEALVNVRKHAGGPCRVELTIEAFPERGTSRLTVRDHGSGCARDPRRQAADRGTEVGIHVMRERIAALGGTLHWSSAPGSGTTVMAELQEGV